MNFAQKVAGYGRGIDNARRGGVVGHMGPGDVVVPGKLLDRHPNVLVQIVKAHMEEGSDWRDHIARFGRTNPKTGLKEFQWPEDEEDQQPQYWEDSADAAAAGAYDYGGSGNDTLMGGDGGDEFPGIATTFNTQTALETPYDAGLATTPNTQTVPETDFGNDAIGRALEATLNAPEGYDAGLATTQNTVTAPETYHEDVQTENLAMPPVPFGQKVSDIGGKVMTGLANNMPFGWVVRGTMGEGPIGAMNDYFARHGDYSAGPPLGQDATGTEAPASLGDEVVGLGFEGPLFGKRVSAPAAPAPAAGAQPMAPASPGATDPWAAVFGDSGAPAVGPAARGIAPATPTPDRLAASGFNRPAEMPPPGFLNIAGGMTPLQIRSMLATYGVNAEDPMWRDPLAAEYYKNQLLRSLISGNGQIAPYGSILPIEHQFLQQVLGLDYQPGDTGNLLAALQDMPAATGGYGRAQPNRPPGAIPLSRGGYMAPTHDGGYAFGGQGIGPTDILYLDADGNWTPDRSKAYLPDATAQLNGMANVVTMNKFGMPAFGTFDPANPRASISAL